ncbi:MAG: zinc ribbon domain-containing protein [Deltaproteobacteria bacterium]|nr:zinc ribbon domain-containing protein [Deltaproteobacteria bacterium]
MPIYEFKCQKCGREFEELVLNSREQIACPDCGDHKCEKFLSSFRFGSKSGRGDSSFTSQTSTSSSCGSCAATSCAGCGSSH